MFIFAFMCFALGDWAKKKFVMIFVSFLPMFSFRSFVVFILPFRSSNHFKFIFVHGVRLCSKLIIFSVLSNFPHTTCWQNYLFIVYSCLLRLIDCMCMDLLLSSLLSPNLCVCFYDLWLTKSYCFDYCNLQHNLKSEVVMHPASFFFLKMVLAIWSLLWFPHDFGIVYFKFCENAIEILRKVCIKFVDLFA